MIASIFHVDRNKLSTFISNYNYEVINQIFESNSVAFQNMKRFYDPKKNEEFFYDSKEKLIEFCKGKLKDDQISYVYGYIYVLLVKHLKENVFVEPNELFQKFFFDSKFSSEPTFFIDLPKNEYMPLVVSFSNNDIYKFLKEYKEFLLSETANLDTTLIEFLNEAIEKKLDIVLSTY